MSENIGSGSGGGQKASVGGRDVEGQDELEVRLEIRKCAMRGGSKKVAARSVGQVRYNEERCVGWMDGWKGRGKGVSIISDRFMPFAVKHVFVHVRVRVRRQRNAIFDVCVAWRGSQGSGWR